MSAESHQRASFKYRQRNREAIAARSREYRKQNRRASKNTRLKTDYGITVEQYDALAMQQHALCASCRKPPDKKGLCVDHCHESGLVRGLLCHACNCALGLLRDDPARINALRDYIHQFQWLK